jgi:hypothetical protein
LDALPDDWERPAEPDFPEWAGWLWRAWQDLDGERVMIPVGMGGMIPGRIPWSAVDRWAARHGVIGSDFDFLARAITAMDRVLMEHTNKGNGGHGN